MPQATETQTQTQTQTITPYLLYEDADAAMSWLAGSFGFREVDRMTGAAGGLHLEAEVEHGGARLYLGSPPGDFRGPARAGRTSLLYVLVDDVDQHYLRAREQGAEIVDEVGDQPYGHRRYTCRDPQGHEWTFATPIESEGGRG
jgi:uncharacterized glyoxalase superfamily protein PhnB